MREINIFDKNRLPISIAPPGMLIYLLEANPERDTMFPYVPSGSRIAMSKKIVAIPNAGISKSLGLFKSNPTLFSEPERYYKDFIY